MLAKLLICSSALLTIGCVPAAMLSHVSDPATGNGSDLIGGDVDGIDQTTDFGGMGGCLELPNTDFCAFIGVKRSRGHKDETGLGGQALLLHKFRRGK